MFEVYDKRVHKEFGSIMSVIVEALHFQNSPTTPTNPEANCREPSFGTVPRPFQSFRRRGVTAARSAGDAAAASSKLAEGFTELAISELSKSVP